MASITFATRTNFNTAAVKAKIEAVVAEKARVSCEIAGQRAVSLIASAAPRSKDGRHRSKSLTDSSSYDYDVTRQANGARLNIHIVGSSEFKAKFFSVNFGSKEHPILPRGNYKLKFPGTNARAGTTVAVLGVNHPGTTGVHFYEAGLREAIALIPTLIR